MNELNSTINIKYRKIFEEIKRISKEYNTSCRKFIEEEEKNIGSMKPIFIILRSY